jgi:predicted enzyme related to lactoylglutathione lyase
MGVLGVGGVFFKSMDPDRLKSWYAKHLGVGAFFQGYDLNHREKSIYTTWNPLVESDKIFVNGKEFALAYRVDDLQYLIKSLKDKAVDVTLVGSGAGECAHLIDLEGNKVILVQQKSAPPGTPLVAGRVTGLGGVFFKCRDSNKLKEWYVKNLGFNITKWGCTFEWYEAPPPGAAVPATTAWSPFEGTTTYFAPSEKEFMFNYRVKDLYVLMENLGAEGLVIVGKPEDTSYGKFGWILDPEGNKIELWEPVDSGL